MSSFLKKLISIRMFFTKELMGHVIFIFVEKQMLSFTSDIGNWDYHYTLLCKAHIYIFNACVCHIQYLYVCLYRENIKDPLSPSSRIPHSDSLTSLPAELTLESADVDESER